MPRLFQNILEDSEMPNITLGHLQISEVGKRYVNEALNTNRLSRGKFTDKFESKFSALHGCKHGIFMASGTCALQVALAALAEKYCYEPGDEIIVPAITFIATSNIVLMLGFKPVFVDVDECTYNMDPDEIAKKITDRTRAIIPVHLFGLPANMERIMSIARYYGLQVIEDSCETVGAGINGKSVGSFGNAACFSQYIAHHITSGIGGIITTNDASLEPMCRSLMQHGRDSIYTKLEDDDTPTANIIERRYRFERLGYSFRASELEAALGLAELERWEENIATRRRNAHILMTALHERKVPLQLPYTPEGYDHSFMMFPMVCREGVDREKLLMHLENNNIETRYLFPLLSQPIYRRLFPGMAEKYPVAQRLEKQGFFIGIHQGLTTEDIAYVAGTIAEYFGGQ